MNNRYAIVVDGLVVNMVAWDGISEWSPELGEAIPAPDGVGIGWSYVDDEFIAPPVPEPTHAELVAQADAAKATLLAIATSKISILQDAVDLEMATSEETAALTSWKKYRVLLSRIDTSKAPDIDWPEQPE